mgnify:FL=1
MTLTPLEQQLADAMARARDAENRRVGVRDQRVAPLERDIDLLGAGAEVAFCRLANAYPDLTSHVRAGGADCVLADGRTVDVKATPHPAGALLAPVGRAPHADVYVLITGTFPTYTYRGACPADDLHDATRLADLGHGPVYRVPQGDLQ